MSILQIRGISKRYAGLRALDDVHLAVQPGSVHAIIGPNGAGKSTLLNCLVGRVTPDEGEVRFDGLSLLGLEPHEISQAGVARMFQTPEIFGELSLLDNVLIPALARADGSYAFKAWSRVDDRTEVIERAEAMLDQVGLADHRQGHAAALSRGDKRRLGLAMCLVQSPRLLLLDEPTAGMSRADTEQTVELLQRLAGGVTTVIIEHDMQVVFTLASRISVMAQGRVIAEGDPAAIRGDERVQQAYLGGMGGKSGKSAPGGGAGAAAEQRP
ncbi:MAG: ABC transporter ATP-binding protein [Burkholderiales bacterium]|nr:ABC transporter ATP-binding protein [Burkholderiales bacterium]